MKCNQFKNSLLSFYEGSLSEKETSEMSAHFKECASCFALNAKADNFFTEIENEKATEVNPYFTSNVLRKISERNTNEQWVFPYYLFAKSKLVLPCLLIMTITLGNVLYNYTQNEESLVVSVDDIKNELVNDNDNNILTLNED